jgi:hypothetical protein
LAASRSAGSFEGGGGLMIAPSEDGKDWADKLPNGKSKESVSQHARPNILDCNIITTYPKHWPRGKAIHGEMNKGRC